MEPDTCIFLSSWTGNEVWAKLLVNASEVINRTTTEFTYLNYVVPSGGDADTACSNNTLSVSCTQTEGSCDLCQDIRLRISAAPRLAAGVLLAAVVAAALMIVF